MQARELSGTNESFKSFTENMKKAVEAMGPASDQLKVLCRKPRGSCRLAPASKPVQELSMPAPKRSSSSTKKSSSSKPAAKRKRR